MRLPSLLCLVSFVLLRQGQAQAQDVASDRLPVWMTEFVEAHCLDCHSGKRPKARFDLARFRTLTAVSGAPEHWKKVLGRLRAGDMPPADEDQPSADDRGRAIEWIDRTLREAACGDGVTPGPARTRRLNRSEYAATIRDLLGVHFDAGAALPADGAGGEGYDNVAETLTLSSLHLEKYLEAAERALDYVRKDPSAREKLFVREPDAKTEATVAARRIFERFLPLAFRRALREGELEDYLALFDDAQTRGESFEDAVVYAATATLISPHFLLLVEEPAASGESVPLGEYELASRLSYFLWGTLPDARLLELAEKRELGRPETLAGEVERLLGSRRVAGFAASFTEQWLGTRDLGRSIRPDRRLTRRYDDNLEAVIKYEPLLFFGEILRKNLSILTVLDSDFTFVNKDLARHYRLSTDGLREHPKRVSLPEDSPRGGVLGMAAVLAVSSYPHRTSPVLRGKWILETLLGTPPAPPPPDVPELAENDEENEPRSVRERLELHREKPECASCHDRIDPLGFGLEGFDPVGRARRVDRGMPIDTKGRLPDGTEFEGIEGLRRVLLGRKDDVVRHLIRQLLGYALARELSLEDDCVVEEILEKARAENYRAHTLVREIVLSVPFRSKAGSVENVD